MQTQPVAGGAPSHQPDDPVLVEPPEPVPEGGVLGIVAAKLISDHKARYPGIDAFLQRCVQQAMDVGYVTTIMGRRRAIPEVYSTNTHTRALGERLAINSVIQGSAADLIKKAMVDVSNRIANDRLPMKLLLQIHDELVLETPDEHAANHASACG